MVGIQGHGHIGEVAKQYRELHQHLVAEKLPCFTVRGVRHLLGVYEFATVGVHLARSLVVESRRLPALDHADLLGRHARSGGPGGVRMPLEVRLPMLANHQNREFTPRVLQLGFSQCLAQLAPRDRHVRAVQQRHPGAEGTAQLVDGPLDDRTLIRPQIGERGRPNASVIDGIGHGASGASGRGKKVEAVSVAVGPDMARCGGGKVGRNEQGVGFAVLREEAPAGGCGACRIRT